MISLLKRPAHRHLVSFTWTDAVWLKTSCWGFPHTFVYPIADGAVRLTLPGGIPQGCQRGMMAAKEGKPSRAHLNQTLIVLGLLPTIFVPLRFWHRAPMPEHTDNYVQITHTHGYTQTHTDTHMQAAHSHLTHYAYLHPHTAVCR